jgi:hypothetical protein
MGEPRGRWIELPNHLYVTNVCHCDCCGKLVARRYLKLEEQGRSFRFCNEDCVRLWYEYWLPRYSANVGLDPPGGH